MGKMLEAISLRDPGGLRLILAVLLSPGSNNGDTNNSSPRDVGALTMFSIL